MLGPQHQLRQAEIERLSSPDQLDLPMRVTSPWSWLILGGISLIVAFFAYWLVFGSLPDKVEGRGMLLAGEQVQTVQAQVRGELTRLLVKKGDFLDVGTPIGTMTLLNQEEAIASAQTRVEDLERKTAAQKRDLGGVLGTYQRQLAAADEEVRTLRRLHESGRIAGPVLRDAESRKAAIESQMANVRISSADYGLQLDDARRELSRLTNQKDVEVRSQAKGRVTALLAATGQVLEVGQRIVNVESADSAAATPVERARQAKLWLFVALADGKKIVNGMQVRISPANVRSEDFGFILGKVAQVSPQPVTPEEVRILLNNDEMARDFSKGSPYLVEVALEVLSDGRFDWTSAKGETLTVDTNTPCSAQIIVDERAPFTLIIPKLKQMLTVS